MGIVVVVVSAGVVATVASGEAVGLAAGAVVSVFCSHAASSAAPARMQMYFFIRFLDCEANIELMLNRSKLPFRPYVKSKRRFIRQAMGIGHRAAGQLPAAGVDSTCQGRLLFAGFL